MSKISKDKVLDGLQQHMAWVILIVISIIFSIFSKNFFTVRNVMNILTQNAYIIICGFGMAILMMSGGFDLSIGYQLSVIGVISGKLLVEKQMPVPMVVVIAILLGVVLEEANTIGAKILKIPQMMVSFGTMTIYQGISYTISNSLTTTNLPNGFKWLGQGTVAGISVPVIIATVFFLIMSFLINRTYFGRYVFALGGNEEATRLAGINVANMKYIIGAMCGAFVGLAAVLLIGRTGSSSSTIGPGTEFTVITGVILGGVSIRGGEGKISSVVAGILILAILSNGMQMIGMGIYLQYIAKGAIMLLAIGFDVFQMNRRNAAKRKEE